MVEGVGGGYGGGERPLGGVGAAFLPFAGLRAFEARKGSRPAPGQATGRFRSLARTPSHPSPKNPKDFSTLPQGEGGNEGVCRSNCPCSHFCAASDGIGGRLRIALRGAQGVRSSQKSTGLLRLLCKPDLPFAWLRAFEARKGPPDLFVRWREPPLTYENVRNGVPEALGGAAGDRHNRRK